MKTHGELRYAANPAMESDFRSGDLGAVWGIKAAPYLTIKVKRLFPRAAPYRTGWITIKDTPEVARDLQWLTERYPLEMTDADREILEAGAEMHRDAEADVFAILSGDRPHPDYVQPTRPPRDYQLVAADLIERTGRLLLNDVLGLGKTYSSLLVLRVPGSLPAVVVCQSHLPSQWTREIAKDFPWLTTHVARTVSPYDPSERREMRGRHPDVLIIPYSRVRGWGDHLAGVAKTVIFDEIQELRRGESSKYVACARIADLARYRVGLTATPIFNYADEIHTIMQVLAPDALGTRAEFIREWQGHAISTFGAADHHAVEDTAALGVYLRAEGLMLRRTRKDVGRELPAEPLRVPHSIDTDEGLLENLIDDAAALAELIVANEARRTELWRARGEFDWKVRRATGIAKATYVAEFVKLLLESEEKVVLFGWHRDVYDIWRDRLMEYMPAFYTGTESPTQKDSARDAFVDGPSRVLVMSLRSGAGLDGLQTASNVAVFGELDWSPGIHDQCIGRLDRDGQTQPVVAYFLVSDHGSDPAMAETLQTKRMQSEPLLDPDRPLVLEAPTGSADRLKKLAEDVLRRRRERKRGS